MSDYKKAFWDKVEKTDSCWNWKAFKRGGYGVFHIKGRTYQAHRISYELLVDKIPERLTLDHLCRNRACVNPKHLEPVTNKINILRGKGACANHARKTHCPKGHPYDKENTRHYRGYRYCKKCKEEYERKITTDPKYIEIRRKYRRKYYLEHHK